MPTMFMTGIFSCFFIVIAGSCWGVSFEPLLQEYTKIQKQALDSHLIPMPISRPVNCPAISVAFADISEQMADIALSLTDGKCYEKHAQIISELARINGIINPDIAKDTPAPENGALIDFKPGQVINISNTQIQTVKNQNSLINGFFELTRDKTCIESFKKSSRLSSVAGTLAKIGTLSLFLPSQVGLGGSAASFLIGGSLLALDKLLQPKFSWKYQKDRRDFMSMTCAFYHLRSNLYYAGFFDVPTPRDQDRLSLVETLHHQLDSLVGRINAQHKAWTETWNRELLVRESVGNPSGNIQLCQLLKETKLFLASPLAQGLNVEERLTVQSFFSKQAATFTQLFEPLPVPKPEATKTLAIISALEKLSHEEVLTLSRKTWQLAYVQSLHFFLDNLSKLHCEAIERVVNDFNQRHDFNQLQKNGAYHEQKVLAYHQLLSRIANLRHDLNWSASAINRLSQKKSLSQFDDGAMNQFDILSEYQNISNELLGKKGWSFVSYLLEQANENIKIFIYRYGKWQGLKDTPENLPEACRDSFVVEKYFDLADSAVEYAYDFLMATDELWSTEDSNRHGWKSLFPFFKSTSMQISQANQAAQLAKEFLIFQKHYSDDEFTSIYKQMQHAMGRVVITVKRQEENRQALNLFKKERCYNRPLPANERS